MKQYVIIGNGVAAVGCIEGIRQTDLDSRIVVISEENHPVYGRPLISYYLEGKTDLSRMNYRAADFYDQMCCEVRYGVRALRIDKKAKAVYLDDGSAVPYDAVCVAAGSVPFVPNFPGLGSVEKRFTFMTLDDTLALEAALDKDAKVLIVGAGLIGLKCAEGIRDRVASITVCDLADHVLSSVLDADCAAVMQKHLEDNGIRFLLGDSADHFDGNRAFMKSGVILDFDILVLAVGVRANTAVAVEVGCEVNRGILVDTHMRTTEADIYAAGDCTEGKDICGNRKVLAILPNAYLQGRCSGINMAGGETVFDKAVPVNSLGFFGLHAMTAGTADGELHEERGNGTLKRFFVKDGLLTGFILMGETDRAGIYTSLIREKVPLDTIDFELLKKNATTTAFSAESRRKKFGGVV